jgi:flagellar protein FliO/FliZ
MEFPDVAKYAAALLVVIALIMALHWVLRRFFADGAKGRPTALRRRDRRLGVIEAAQVSPRHRLLLVRRDDREHLLLIGGATEIVIETDIPHVSGEADVRVRPVEPRLGAERERGGGSYRPADEFEPRAPAARRPLTTPGFGLPGRDDDDFGDDRPEREYGAGEPVRRGDYRDRDRDEEVEDHSPFAALSSSPYGRDDRASGSGRSPVPGRGERSATDYHVVDDDADDRSGEEDRERDVPDPTESRILSRFLKRDEP